jgi:hypothetical protein
VSTDDPSLEQGGGKSAVAKSGTPQERRYESAVQEVVPDENEAYLQDG